MAKNSIREASRNARAARMRRMRLLLLMIGILLAFLIGLFIYQAAFKPASQAEVTTGGGWVVLPSGLKYKDVVLGSGPAVKAGETAAVQYTGRLEDGSKFDSSEGGQPYEFKLGAGTVIKGWDEGVAGMQVGGKRTLVIPPDLAYGPGGYPPVIPANATLTFDVELMAIK